ncbi:MAG: hemerythrin family protein [Gammaproteobacteria bacterium]|nr:hemerythrin family protein [Gammaproteobacteria bacterium]
MKKFLEWQHDWSLGIEIIDRQHRQLAVMFNKIAELYLNNDGQTDSEQRSNQLHEQLNIFFDKVCEHFNDEEDLMLKANYPGHTEHAREHLMLRAELKQYIRHIEEGLDHINIGTLNSLKVWFISHIISSDKEFADFLQVHSQDEVTSSYSVDT